MKTFRYITCLLLALSTILTVSGCGRGNSSVRLSDIVPMTAETLTILLLGDPNLSPTQTAPADKPLLQKGVYDSVAITADHQGFADVSRGTLTEDDVRTLQQKVVEKVNKDVSRRGFSATETSYPPGTFPDKTLVATLVPVVHQTGSEEDKTKGKARTLILVRVTIADPKSGNILAQRDYYSGADVKRPDEAGGRRRLPEFRVMPKGG